MKCRKCGQEISEDSKFCPSCGESVVPPVPTGDGGSNKDIWKKVVPAALAALLVLGGGSYVYSVKQSEKAAIEERKVMEQEKEAAKKKQQVEKKKADQQTQETQETQEAEATTYVVLDEVVNGVYLHTEPNKEDKSNRRGLLMPGDTVEFTEIIKNSDCTWGKTKDNMYVCVYETWSTEDKPVGKYMAPVGQTVVKQSTASYPDGNVAFGNGRSGFTFHSNGEVERFVLPPTSTAGWGYTAKGTLQLVSNDGDTITYKIVYTSAEEYPNPHPDLAGESTRAADIYENNITVVYHVSSNTVDIEGYASSCVLGGLCQ